MPDLNTTGGRVVLSGVGFDSMTETQLCDHILQALERSQGGFIVTANLDHLVRCRRHRSYRELVGTADIVVADGMPLIWASRLQATPLPERVAGNLAEVDAIVLQLRTAKYPEAPLRYLDARVLMAQSKYRDAAELLEKSRSLFDRTGQLLKQADYQLAICYRMVGNFDQELVALRQAVGQDPLWIPARESLAAALRSTGRQKEAMVEYYQIIGQPNPPASAVINYARLLFLDGLGKGAEQDWRPLHQVLAMADKIPEAAASGAILRAELLVAEGKSEEAEELLKQRIESEPSELLARRALISLLTRRQEWDAVERELTAAQEKAGDSPTLRLERARFLLQRDGQEENVLEQLDALAQPLDDWSGEQRAQLAAGFASLFLAVEDYARSEKFARLVAESKTVQPTLDLYLMLFDLAMRSNNVDAMTEALARVKSIEGEGPLSQIGEAVRLTVRAGNEELSQQERDQFYDQALSLLTAAAIARPGLSRIPRLQGNIHDRRGQSELAVQGYLQAINLGEQDPQLISRAILLLFDQRRFVEADEVVRKLQEQKTPFSSELTRVASEVSLRLENFDRALSLAKSWAGQSDKVDDHVWLAQVYSITGDFEAAKVEFRTAIERDPTAPASWVSLVQMLARQGELDEARATIEEAQQSLSSETQADAIAQCYQAIQDFALAEESYRKALESSPDDPAILRRFAEFYLAQNNTSGAEPLLKQLVDKSSKAGQSASEVDRSWARRNLGLIFGLSGSAASFAEAEELLKANMSGGTASLEDQRAMAIILGNRRDRPSLAKAISLLENVVKQQAQFSLSDNFLLAELYSRNDDWSRYSRTMRSVLGNGGAQNVSYVRAYARALVNRGELNEAQLWSSRLKSLAPAEQTTALIEAELLYKSNDYARLRKLLEDKAANEEDWRWAAELSEIFAASYQDQGKTEEADFLLKMSEDLFTKLSELNTTNKHLIDAFHARQGKFELIFDQLSDPKISPESLAGVSQTALRTGLLDESQTKQLLKFTSAAYKEHPTVDVLGLCVADLYAWLGDWKQAEENYDAVLANTPNSIPALNNMAMILAMTRQNLVRALEVVEQAGALVGTPDYLLDTRGLVRLASGGAQLAAADFQAAIDQQVVPDRYFHLAQALYALNQLEPARAALKQALDLGLKAEHLHPLERPAFQQLVSKL